MLFHLLYPLHTRLTAFNLFRYITFRTAMAMLTAMVVSLILGPWLIRRLRYFQIGQELGTGAFAVVHKATLEGNEVSLTLLLSLSSSSLPFLLILLFFFRSR